jgi:hypothetical protein
MSQLTSFLRSLGAHGAVANVRSVLEARRQEDWIVAALSARLDRAASSPSPVTAAGSGRAA